MIRLFTSPRIRRLMSPEKTRVTVAFIAMTFRGLLALGVPFFFGRTIELVQVGADASEVWTSASLMVGVSFLTAFSQFWMRWLYIGSSRRFEARLRDELFEHLTRLSFGYFNRSKTGDIMSRLTADVEAVRMGVGPGVMHMYQTGVMAIGAITVMSTVSWRLTAIALVPMALIFVFIRSLMPRMHDASLRVQEQLSSVSAMAQESFSGSRVVKAFAREDYEIGRFRTVARRYIDDSMNLAMTRARMHSVIEVMAGLVTVAVVFFGGSAVIRGELSLGPFVSFFGYFMMLIWPMIALGWTMALFQRAAVALGRLEEVFDTEPEIVGGDAERPALFGGWKIRDLSFRHEGMKAPVFSGVDIDLPAGSSLAIVGPTGSGKSTLVQLFGRLFDPPPGTVLQDGLDVRDLDLGFLRRSISMVPQETFLFSDTVHANIAYANPESSRETVAEAAEKSRIRESVEGFAAGFDEVIGERGVTLSGGQKQRIAIARALIHDASTLVLDDCLSAIDTNTEEQILAQLGRAMEGRTTVIVAHRLSSVMHCDQIVVLKDGGVAERGRHEELIELGGWYADTWRRQLISQELEAA